VFTDSCQRIGHGGASALAPANTLASFNAALEVGIDMIEFDVRASRGELVLAHTLLDARLPRRVRLADALDHLSSRRFEGIELNVDLKRTGCEPGLLDALRSAGMLERTLISSQLPEILDRVRALEPRARLGISVAGRLSRLTHHWRDWRTQVLDGLRKRRWEAVMAHHRLVEAGLLEEVVARSGLLYAWTVNERPAIDSLRRLGVHGIATADPRLFA
jgi:glycerophosphoryl diester phosphodiesterase